MPEGTRLERTGDPETDEILSEIEREGVPADPDEEKAPEFERVEMTEKKPESKRPGEKEEAAPESEPKPEEEEEEEGGESEEEEGEEVETPSPAPRTSRPASKVDYWKQKAKKIEAELSEFKKKATEADIERKLAEVAKAENIPVETVKALRDAIASTISKPTETDARIEKVLKRWEVEEHNERQEEGFRREFESTLLPVLEKDPEMTQERVEEIYDDLFDRALDPDPKNDFDPKTGQPRKSLVQLYFDSQTKSKKFTGERSRIKSSGLFGRKSLGEMTAEDLSDENMSDEEFDKLSDEAAATSPSLVRPTKRTL